MSNPAPATRGQAVMARPRQPAVTPPPPWLARSVATAAPAGRAGRGRRPGRGDFVPHASVHVDAVAIGLARGGVSGIGVERVSVVGRLLRAVGPGDRAERAG